MLQDAVAKELPNGFRDLPVNQNLTCSKPDCKNHPIRNSTLCAGHLGLPSLTKIETIIQCVLRRPRTVAQVFEIMEKGKVCESKSTVRNALNYGILDKRLSRKETTVQGQKTYIYSAAAPQVEPKAKKPTPPSVTAKTNKRRARIMQAIREHNNTSRLIEKYLEHKYRQSIPPSTLTYDLNALVQAKKLVRAKRGVGTEFVYNIVQPVKEAPVEATQPDTSKKNGTAANAQDFMHVMHAFFSGLETRVLAVEDRLTKLETQVQAMGATPTAEGEIKELKQFMTSIKSAVQGA